MQINQIYNEDCRETMSRMPDGFIDLTVTSPPYDNLRTYNDGIDKSWNETVWKPIISELYRVTKSGGVCVLVVGDATINGSETGTSFRQALYAMECGFNLHDTMIYVSNKPPLTHNRYEQCFEYMFVFSKGSLNTFNAIMSKTVCAGTTKRYNYGEMTNAKMEKSDALRYRDESTVVKDDKIALNVWKFTTGMSNTSNDAISFQHPATYPEKLARDHIYSWSNEGDLVYDPFMGSGTTAKMAHLLKRNWIGSEISDEYVELANKRIQPYLAQTTLF